ncbi:hypothetical protein N7471_008871 [Penicillium samsonianum]|uniref:uncharacterized protein n=1 Tax=Penicillium samsonianum TaxID=1882272 RepID=UPI002548EAD1|nr:uncharacterized protein N7471_008871 [Penicillium samsonianum]KAJ6133656.1 hypothetical protein N7471_008871 [Penicillium samsonianum]
MLEYGVLEENIFYSRDLAFAQAIMQQTNHRGVDVVLNSLAGEALRATFECMAHVIGLSRLVNATVTFAACDLNTILQHDPAWTYNLLQGAMELWQLGVFRPTSLFTTFKYSQLETAFRQLQSGRHGGKVVLTIDDDAVVEALPWSPLPHQFQEDATYLLSGGLGGLGRSAARWMASRGAKYFLFLSRSGGSNADAQLLLNELKTPDVMRRSFGLTLVTRLPCIKRSNLMPKNVPYPGLHSRRDDIDTSVRSKARGSWNLHEVLPNDLDFSTLPSSCGDALAHYRRSRDLSGTSLDLGHMLDIGVIAERTDNLSTAPLRAAFGNQAVPQDEFHALLESL